jgi:hypothetical protein
MGHKNVCFACRKAFNMGSDFNKIKASYCPDCQNIMTQMTQRFRPPKKSNDMAWKTAHFLVNNGFPYQYIYDEDIIPTYVPYPETLNEAKNFVIKYQSQKMESK